VFAFVQQCQNLRFDRQSTINDQRSTINDQRSTINNQQSTINNQRPHGGLGATKIHGSGTDRRKMKAWGWSNEPQTMRRRRRRRRYEKILPDQPGSQ
jgi:hypothetical protein